MLTTTEIADIAGRLMASVGWTFAGILILFAGTWFWDKLDPIDYTSEIRRGNMAAAIKLAAVLLALVAIVITAIVT